MREILTHRACLHAVRDALIALAGGEAVNPVRGIVSTGSGWFGTMPAFVSGAGASLGAKLVTFFPENAARGVPTHRAVVVLFEAETGVPYAVVDADTITERRTAAVSALAARRFAGPGRLALLGAGVQGRAHLEAFASDGLATSVVVWSRNAERAAALVAAANELGLEARTAASPQAAAAEADLVVTATSATDPLLDADDVRDGAFVAAVGACVPSRRELGGALMARSALYADDEAAARVESGDVLIAERELGRTLALDGTLGEMLADPEKKRARPGAPVVFISLGLGVEDVACARFALANA